MVKQAQKEVQVDEYGVEVVKLKGPWHVSLFPPLRFFYAGLFTVFSIQVHVLGALPLRNMSRIWGYVNSLELPIWFRPYGFKLYANVFGCNLDEIEHQDLTVYKSLGDFFYRRLEPGARPVDDAVLVSPANGTILHLGAIADLRVEQVTGITYSLDALLGVDKPHNVKAIMERNPDMDIVDDKEFANVNGIEYSLGQLLGSGDSHNSSPQSTPSPSRTNTLSTCELASKSTSANKYEDEGDASVFEPGQNIQETLARDISVVKQVGGSPLKPKHERKHTVRT
jgi:phosphatidylserine decarboxylase